MRERAMSQEQLHTIAAALIGHCDKDIDDICEANDYPLFDEWTVADAITFDELVFRCSKCGWWTSGDDHAEDEPTDFICYDCG